MSTESKDLIEMFRAAAKDVSGYDYSFLTEASPLSELDLDSLTMLELVGQVEEQLDIRIPDEVLSESESIGDVLRAIETLRAESAA